MLFRLYRSTDACRSCCLVNRPIFMARGAVRIIISSIERFNVLKIGPESQGRWPGLGLHCYGQGRWLTLLLNDNHSRIKSVRCQIEIAGPIPNMNVETGKSWDAAAWNPQPLSATSVKKTLTLTMLCFIECHMNFGFMYKKYEHDVYGKQCTTAEPPKFWVDEEGFCVKPSISCVWNPNPGENLYTDTKVDKMPRNRNAQTIKGTQKTRLSLSTLYRLQQPLLETKHAGAEYSALKFRARAVAVDFFADD